MKNLFNNQLKYLSFHKNTLPLASLTLKVMATSTSTTCVHLHLHLFGRLRYIFVGIAYPSVSYSSIGHQIINRSSRRLVINQNIIKFTKNKYGLINSHTPFSTSTKNNDTKFKNNIMSTLFFWVSTLQRLNILICKFNLNVYPNINFLNVNIFIYFISLVYKFYYIVSNADGFGILIIYLLVSTVHLFLITDYILNKFKYSDNIIVHNHNHNDKHNPPFSTHTTLWARVFERGDIFFSDSEQKNIIYLIFFIICSMIFLNTYASSELSNNMDEYIKVYNNVNNNYKSILLIIPFIPKNSKFFKTIKYSMRNNNNWIFLDNYNKGINTSSIQNYNKKSNKRSLYLSHPSQTLIAKELFHSNVFVNVEGEGYKTPTTLSRSRKIISRSRSRSRSRISINKLTEGDWRELWSRKFNKLISLGIYTPDLWDKLLFVYLNEKKENLKSKYTFNNFLSGSQLISYNFNKNIKKVDLNSLYKYLKSFFKTLSSLISFPVLEIYPDKIRIRLFYYVVPSKTKIRIHKLLHKYIRSDEKLYKEIILRRNFKIKMEQFKIKLFIAKWKEDNNFIGIPYPISYFKGLTVGQPCVPLNEEALLTHSTSSYAHAHVHAHAHAHNHKSSNSSEQLERLSSSTNNNVTRQKYPGVIENLRSSNGNFYKPYEYNTSLDLLKLDFSKLSQQYDQLESLLRDLHNITQDNNSIMKDVPGKPLKENIKINKPEYENIHSQSTNLGSQVEESLISISRGSVDAKEPILDVYQSFAEQPNKHTESLKILKDRKVSTIVSLNKEKFKYLIFTLEKLFKKTIILDLVRLKYPYHESNILAQVLSLSCKTKDFRQIMRKLLYTATISNPTKMVRTQNFSIIPSYLSGIKVRLGGRLITQRVVPRFTVQSLQIGSLARGKVNFTDSSRITLKNKRGAFSFTVTTSHIFDK